jgi:hypothetical protein
MAPAPKLTSQTESSDGCDCAMPLLEHVINAKAEAAKVTPEIRLPAPWRKEVIWDLPMP